MDHFSGVTPRERYDNDLLNEIRESNRLNRLILEELGRNAQATQPKQSQPKQEKKTRQRRKVV